MSDPLFELLAPYLTTDDTRKSPSPKNSITTSYLSRLTTLPLSSLNSSEPQSLTQNTQSHLLSLQALSQRSHSHITASHAHLSNLYSTLPSLATSITALRDQIPSLDTSAQHFSETYNKSSATSNPLLERRRKALLLSRNVDRLQNILDLPTLLSTAISSSSSTTTQTTSSTSSASLNYATALDLNSHIKRLSVLYPESSLVAEVEAQADVAMQDMATNLIASLKIQGIKLATAMRTISWLRRVAPELDAPVSSTGVIGNREGALGALFLVCRLSNLNTMLDTLEPLKDLAEQETSRRISTPVTDTAPKTSSAWSGGQQTERYLKRYIEIFREQSFAIISMFRSIFPADTATQPESRSGDPLTPLPSALSTFPLHLVSMLQTTLKRYLPNIQDKSSRDSLLTQVLYCAGSLGRLGGDFSGILAELHGEGEDEDEDGEEEEENEEWVEVVRKHRVLAGRLESLVAG